MYPGKISDRSTRVYFFRDRQMEIGKAGRLAQLNKKLEKMNMKFKCK